MKQKTFVKHDIDTVGKGFAKAALLASLTLFSHGCCTDKPESPKHNSNESSMEIGFRFLSRAVYESAGLALSMEQNNVSQTVKESDYLVPVKVGQDTLYALKVVSLDNSYGVMLFFNGRHPFARTTEPQGKCWNLHYSDQIESGSFGFDAKIQKGVKPGTAKITLFAPQDYFILGKAPDLDKSGEDCLDI